MRSITYQEYLELRTDRLEWLYERLIPAQGIVLLIGPPKSGKSYLALDIARRVTVGAPFLNRITPRPRRVLYLQLDTSEPVWRDRLRCLQHALPFNDNLTFLHPDSVPMPFDITDRNTQLQLRHVIEEVNPAMVVIDVLREIHNADENDATEMRKVAICLQHCLHDRAALVLHHTRKLNPDYDLDINPISAARGSSYLTGRVDACWLMYDNLLSIASRFAEPMRVSYQTEPNGMLRFPVIP